MQSPDPPQNTTATLQPLAAREQEKMHRQQNSAAREKEKMHRQLNSATREQEKVHRQLNSAAREQEKMHRQLNSAAREQEKMHRQLNSARQYILLDSVKTMQSPDPPQNTTATLQPLDDVLAAAQRVAKLRNIAMLIDLKSLIRLLTELLFPAPNPVAFADDDYRPDRPQVMEFMDDDALVVKIERLQNSCDRLMREFADKLAAADHTSVAIMVGDMVYTHLRAGFLTEARKMFTALVALSPQARQGSTLPPDTEIELRSLCASLGPAYQ